MTATPPDVVGFAREVDELYRSALADQGSSDLTHLYHVERMGRTAAAIGWLTAWWGPNPLSVLALAFSRTTRTVVGHHVCHRAYQRVPDVPRRYTDEVFGRGWRRLVDWLDWADPVVWRLTHNCHHAHTNQEADPDLRSYAWVSRHPRLVRLAILALAACSFKATYYAKKLYQADSSHRAQLAGAPSRPLLLWQIWRADVCGVLLKIGVYPVFQFILLPLLFWPLGAWAVFSVACNSLLAEMVTQAQVFVCVGSNHVGRDLPHFETRPSSREEHYLRAVAATVDYSSGGTDFWDVMHVWCNYQVAHHLWPDLTLLQYRRLQPRLEALCRKRGLPYRKEPVWRRFGAAVDLYLGRGTHQPVPSARDWLAHLADDPSPPS